MKQLLYTGILFFLLCNCQQEEEMISGDISGIITTYNQDRMPRSDQSGIRVDLYDINNVLMDDHLTDSIGRYTFRDVMYGKYRIEPVLEHYVCAGISQTVYHIGGYSPTLFNSQLYEVPTFELLVDSMAQLFFYEIQVFMRLKEGVSMPASYYPMICFFSNTPNVSYDQFKVQGYGTAFDYSPEPGQVYAEITYFDMPLDSIGSDTAYCRFYPVATGEGPMSFHTFYYTNEALGKPSNVVRYIWNQ
jgi:hypothetical protein